MSIVSIGNFLGTPHTFCVNSVQVGASSENEPKCRDSKRLRRKLRKMNAFMPSDKQPLLISGLEVRVLPGSPLNPKHLQENCCKV